MGLKMPSPSLLMTHQKGDSSYREPDRLEEWHSKSSMTFSRQGQGPALGQYNQRAQHRTGFIWLGSSCTQRDLRVLVDNKLTMSQECVTAAKD